MQVINSLIEQSFGYTAEKEIVAYCQDDAVKEPLEYQEALWETCVEEGITFTEEEQEVMMIGGGCWKR